MAKATEDRTVLPCDCKQQCMLVLRSGNDITFMVPLRDNLMNKNP